MSPLDAILLGLVQGLAEFLPISSSGHLVIAERILNVGQSDILFEVFLHFATLLAIFIYFKKDILSIKKKEAVIILVASIPAAVVGILFQDQLEILFGSAMMVSLFLIVTGVINLVTDKKLNKEVGILNTKKTGMKKVGMKEAVVIGIFQAFAVIPGISRSGSTVAGGVLQGVDRSKAFRFSFLMVIPVILGASLLQLFKFLGDGGSGINMGLLLIGGLTAFTSAFLSLRIFEYVIKKARLEVFGYYCIGLGSLFFILELFWLK